jgi:hypothetical protein
VQALRLTSASRNYSRNLVVDTERTRPPGVAADLDLAWASATLHQSIEVVARALTGPKDGTYIRSSSLFDWVERRLEDCPWGVPTDLALRDFKLLDGTMAHLAELMGLGITDYDTAGIRS